MPPPGEGAGPDAPPPGEGRGPDAPPQGEAHSPDAPQVKKAQKVKKVKVQTTPPPNNVPESGPPEGGTLKCHSGQS